MNKERDEMPEHKKEQKRGGPQEHTGNMIFFYIKHTKPHQKPDITRCATDMLSMLVAMATRNSRDYSTFVRSNQPYNINTNAAMPGEPNHTVT